ncbi:hypothetical protein ERW51_10305 [Aliivibrio finisterrensis]|uniref:hypothetical protein n=1 Tax=Aliivibrio finisterrensis TaxID=511998 RepID=UPI00102253AD|nr:hypothetical protein [Aliivibrio finisterrensis]RYU68089.1 hypothetical protein ERW54_10500 [Aliivibrio finisterrensis]RYU71757.1 hypothetical protein ERW51_10305 [Aliivibrio finisterrensis]RYU75432.1 hypothetical protein ERW48_09245 [Aliivibrio finisterrensis]
MVYKVVYIEDQDAESVIHDLSQCDLEVVHCHPGTFKETITKVDSHKPDLILMDFRLMQGGGEVNAPAIAQYYRSLSIDNSSLCLPVVLLSNDTKIHGFYDDFTSHDLFDFFIIKENLSENKEKYSLLMKEHIESYKFISTLQAREEDLTELLKVPKKLELDIDPRIKETLRNKKYKSNIYMASKFIFNNVVKSIGVLIGEDVLSARLGIDKSSESWDELCSQLKECEYTGIYSGSYRRWWADGIEVWWNETIEESNHLRRFNSEEKLTVICSKLPGLKLKKVEGDLNTKTDNFWTICQCSLLPVDPSEAFEIQADLTLMPWLDTQYYSYESVRDYDLNDQLTDIEKSRYKDIARGI